MGLAILHHLQSMLDGAEEDIGFVQLRGDLRFEHARRRQGAQGLARIARPQRGIAPAMDKLMHLREEFDLPYAAASADRKSVVQGKSVSVRVDLGGSRIIKKKTKTKLQKHTLTNPTK